MKAALIISTLLATVSAFTAPLATPKQTYLAASSLDGAIGLTVETGRKCPPLGAKVRSRRRFYQTRSLTDMVASK